MVLVCGSGGVGKTTTAAALGLQTATELGGRVLVLTVDPARPTATAFSVHRGRFVLVGSDAEVLKTRGPGTRVIDLHGRTVLPGFNDSHLHPRPEFPEDSIHGEVDLDPDRVPDRNRLVAVLRSKAAATPPGLWVRGFNYQDTRLDGHPTRELLDRVSTNHPILLRQIPLLRPQSLLLSTFSCPNSLHWLTRSVRSPLPSPLFEPLSPVLLRLRRHPPGAL
jgi:pantothenate kinase-related protein Tda10